MNFKITPKEWKLIMSFGILGFIFSMRSWIKFLDTQSVYVGFAIYYIALYLSLYILKSFGLVIFGTHIKSWSQTIGLTLLIFSFFVIFNWESPYINIVTGHPISDTSSIYYMAEDGITWAFWSSFGIINVELLRILTFIISPMILAAIGLFLLHSKPRLQ